MPPVDAPFPDLNHAPFLAIWEVTRACALACVLCRAAANHRRDPRELITEEGFRLIDQVRAFGTKPPLFVLTGGDPMRRPDLADLVRHAAGTGLTVGKMIGAWANTIEITNPRNTAWSIASYSRPGIATPVQAAIAPPKPSHA